MHFTTKVLVLSACLFGLALGAEIPNKDNSDRSDFKRSFEKECASSYSATCLKMDIVQWVDKLSESTDISVLPGVTLVRENSVQQKTNEVVAELAREFPNDPDARLDAYLMKKVTGYLGSHSIKLNLFDSKAAEEVVSARDKGGLGGGGKGGKKGGMGMLLMAGAMMKGTLMTIALGALAALAGKALITGLISLMLSAIIGLKSLAGGGHHSTTYEVVAKPVHTSHHSFHEEHAGGHGGGGGYGGGHSGYGRSFDEPLPAGLQPDFKPY